MPQMLRLWDDDRGVGLISSEWLFLFSILVHGVVTGLVAVRQSLISELTELAQALLHPRPPDPWIVSGQANCESSTAGSSVTEITSIIAVGSVAASPSDIRQAPCD